MREQDMRDRLAQVMADIDEGRLRVARGGPGRYLGSTVLVATMSLSGCAKDGSVEPAPTPDHTTTATADPLPEPVSEYAVVDPEPVPAYAVMTVEPDPSASTSTATSATSAAKATAAPKATATSAATATRTIYHPPLPYMAPDP